MKRFLCLAVFLALTAVVFAQPEISSSVPETVHHALPTELLQKDSDGLRNANLYYNIGVGYYRAGQTGKAMLYFLRALNLDSSHRQARANIDFIQSLFPQDQQPPPRPFLAQVIYSVYDFFSLNRLALAVLILALLVTLCLHWLFHYPPERERDFPALVLLILGLIFLGFGSTLFFKYNRYKHNTRAVVMGESARVYASRDGVKPLYELPEGYVVNLKVNGSQRSQVILADGSGCWVETARLERVVPRSTPQR